MTQETQQTGLTNASKATEKQLQLSIYDKISDAVVAVKSLGATIAESGIFKCRNHAQGEVLALECMVTRQPPLTLVKRNHFMFDQLVMRADAMVAEFQARGGKITNRIKSADKAAATLTDVNGESMDFLLTWEDAQNEPFVYDCKESQAVAAIKAGLEKRSQLKLKDKYATPRSRAQMLWARLVSDAIRTIDPGVNQGQYSPEEIEDTRVSQQPEKTPVTWEVEAKRVEVVQPAATTQAATVSASVVEPVATTAPMVEQVQDAEIVTTEEPAKVSKEAAERLIELAAILIDRGALTGQQLSEACKKRGGNVVSDLTPDKADEIYRILVKKAESLPVSDATTSEPVDSIIGEAEVAELKTLIGDLNQKQPKTAGAIRVWLTERGLSKLNELRRSQYRELKTKTAVENLEAFIASSLAEVKEEIATGN